MKVFNNQLNLYLVTDRSWLKKNTLQEEVEKAIRAGVTFVQLREKNLENDEFISIAKEIRKLTNKYQVPFVINDNVEVALAAKADGVHIGQSDMQLEKAREILGPDKIIGVSVHTVEEAKKAEELGADYLGVGAIFSTSSKQDATLVGVDVLREICKIVSIPVVAIGGINKNNIIELSHTGIQGVAVISAILGQENIIEATKILKKQVDDIVEDKKIKTVLSIAGSDPSGGAGIQADIKTITAHNMYAMSVITALTAQNTTGVYGIVEVDAEFVGNQIDCIMKDIPPDAIKVGMVSNCDIIHVIVEKFNLYQMKNVVIDPVMVSTSKDRLISEQAVEEIKEKLLPIATIVTPNIPEAEILSNIKIKNESDMLLAAQKISKLCNGAVLIKGGHLIKEASDLLYIKGESIWYREKRIVTENTHGTGCTLSSAIACNLAAGYSIPESVRRSKVYITKAIKFGLNLGEKNGPLFHMV